MNFLNLLLIHCRFSLLSITVFTLRGILSTKFFKSFSSIFNHSSFKTAIGSIFGRSCDHAIGLRSGRADHGIENIKIPSFYSTTAVALCTGALSSWKVKLVFSFKFSMKGNNCVSSKILYTSPVIFFSKTTKVLAYF